MRLRIILFIALSIHMFQVKSQTDFRPGYVIKNEGDTVYGVIDYRGDQLMSKVCKFKNSNNKLFSYSPFDIQSFRFVDGKYYVSSVSYTHLTLPTIYSV